MCQAQCQGLYKACKTHNNLQKGNVRKFLLLIKLNSLQLTKMYPIIGKGIFNRHLYFWVLSLLSRVTRGLFPVQHDNPTNAWAQLNSAPLSMFSLCKTKTTKNFSSLTTPKNDNTAAQVSNRSDHPFWSLVMCQYLCLTPSCHLETAVPRATCFMVSYAHHPGWTCTATPRQVLLRLTSTKDQQKNIRGPAH